MDNCVGKQTIKEVRDSQSKVVMLENLRFHVAEEGKGIKGEKKVKSTVNDLDVFRAHLTQMGDLYINDAFGTAHRAHSSMVGVNHEIRAAGFLLKKELDYFAKVLEHPERPMTVVMGGAKVKDKMKLIMNMLDIVDEMIIGGGMAFTFNKQVNSIEIGDSLFDGEGAALVPAILQKAREKGVKIHLPEDFVCGDRFDADANVEIRQEA